jgi:pimeloyl-ACP methyl ester carboxylesterase
MVIDTRIDLGCQIYMPVRALVDSEHRGVVVLSSGYGIDNFDEPIIVSVRDALEEAGFGWLQYVYPERVPENGIEDMTVMGGVHLFNYLLQFIERRFTGVVGFFGISYGANVSIEASFLHKPSVLVAVNCPFDYARYREVQVGRARFEEWERTGVLELDYAGRRQRSSFRFLQEVRHQQLLERASMISTPTLLVQGGRDDIIPTDYVMHLSKQSHNIKHYIVSDADHVFADEECISKLVEVVVPFFLEHLPGA